MILPTRGRKAREARRRAEKAEIRRLEAAEALASTDVALADETDLGLADAAARPPVHESEASPAKLNGQAFASGTVTVQSDADVAEVGLVAGVQRGGELHVLIGSSGRTRRS